MFKNLALGIIRIILNKNIKKIEDLSKIDDKKINKLEQKYKKEKHMLVSYSFLFFFILSLVFIVVLNKVTGVYLNSLLPDLGSKNISLILSTLVVPLFSLILSILVVQRVDKAFYKIMNDEKEFRKNKKAMNLYLK